MSVARFIANQRTFYRVPHALTCAIKKAPKFPDLLRRDFTASAPSRKWCGERNARRNRRGSPALTRCGVRRTARPKIHSRLYFACNPIRDTRLLCTL